MNTIKIKHACAKQDKDFTISYERVGRRYKPLPPDLTPLPPPSIKVGIQALLRREAVTVEKATTIDPSELDAADCPVCGADSWIFCHRCKSQVCDGKSKPGYFYCRKSCGAKGSMVPAMSCDAVDGGSRNIAIGGPTQGDVKRLK